MSCEVRTFVHLPLARSRIAQRVDRWLRRLGYRPSVTSVAVVFVGDRRMTSLNARYRHHPETTDVLSFPGGADTLGDIIISWPQARRQARQFGSSLETEVDLLLVHGLLHLAGYDHERPSDRQRMRTLEQKLLAGQSLIHRVHKLS